MNSTTSNTDDDINDFSDLFDSSQGELLQCELSDVNDLVSAIKSSPLRSLMASPPKTSQMSEEERIAQYLLESPTRRPLQYSTTDNVIAYSTGSSGYLTQTDISNCQSDMMHSFISPLKTDYSKKFTVYSPEVSAVASIEPSRLSALLFARRRMLSVPRWSICHLTLPPLPI